MKRYFVGIAVVGILSLGVMGFTNIPLIGVNHSDACGRMGKSGGGSLTKEQAYDVLANHVNKINPDLEIGVIKDGGGFYMAEILSEDKEVVERLAVDKKSGQLRVIY
jgi:hypothetical protein